MACFLSCMTSVHTQFFCLDTYNAHKVLRVGRLDETLTKLLIRAVDEDKMLEVWLALYIFIYVT
jgi:hypothetical protein